MRMKAWKAAVFHKPNEPLKVEEVEDPKIYFHEILVKVSACGVCNTDLHYIDHGVPTFKKPPMILGHEASGIVQDVGAQVKNIKAGDHVLIPPVFSCGHCYNCRIGRENICLNMIMLGNNIDGAYAEYVKVPAKDCIPLPDNFPLEESSIIADAISTPFHAVKNRAQVRPGDSVVVLGCGGVGINVVQIAAAAGGSVIAVDIMDDKLEMAKRLGAKQAINTSKKNDKAVLTEIRDLTNGGADICIEAIGNPKTIEMGPSTLKPGGRYVQVGYSHKAALSEDLRNDPAQEDSTRAGDHSQVQARRHQQGFRLVEKGHTPQIHCCHVDSAKDITLIKQKGLN